MIQVRNHDGIVQRVPELYHSSTKLCVFEIHIALYSVTFICE